MSGNSGSDGGMAQLARRTSPDTNGPSEHEADAAADQALDRPAARASPPRADRPDESASLGPHTLIPPAARVRLETGFGTDLGHIKLHDNPAAAAAARAVSAQAVSIGDSIAFGAGQLQPGTEPGLRLLAHEVAHIISPASGSTGHRQVMAYPDVTGIDNFSGHELYVALRAAYAAVATAPDVAAWKANVVAAADEWAKDHVSEASAPGVHGDITGLVGSELTYATLRGMVALQVQQGSDNLGGPEGLAPAAVYRVLAEAAAAYLYTRAEGLSEPEPQDTVIYYFTGLVMAGEAVKSAEGRYRLELDGALTAMVDAREAFNRPGADKVALGNRIGELARRALLLAAAIEDLREEQRRGPGNALEDPLLKASGRIAAIRAQAATETKTRLALPGGVELLAVRGLQDQPRPKQAAGTTSIPPEWALPSTTDAAVKAMLSQVDAALTQQEKVTQDLHDAVVPPDKERRYSLPEFAQVYRRWTGFFSAEQERQNPNFLLWASFFDRRAALDAIGGASADPAERDKQLEKIRTPYELTGVPPGISSVSGAMARTIMLSFMIDRLANEMGGTTSTFERGLPTAQLEPVTVSGSATSPTATLRAGFDVVTPEGLRRLGPIGTTSAESKRTAAAFTAAAELLPQPTPVALGTMVPFGPLAPTTRSLAGRPPPSNAELLKVILGPGAVRLANPNAAIVALRPVTEDEGWTYLVDVWEDPIVARQRGHADPELVAREQRTVAPEAARYLLAQQQLSTLQCSDFVPRLPPARGQSKGVPVGEGEVRAHGLSAAQAINAPTAIGKPAVVSPEVKKAAEHLYATRFALPPRPGDLARELEGYLDAFFTKRTETTYRVAAVLLIAQAEHGIKAAIEEGFSPSHMFETAVYATALTAGMSLLAELGPLGKVAGAGIDGYLKINNCSPLAAIAGVATWMYEVAQVSDFRHARAWAFASQAAVHDVLALVDEAVSRAASKLTHQAMERILRGPASTPRQLVSAMGEIARNKGAREPMLREIESQLAELGRAGKQGTPEYRLLEAMQVEVAQVKASTPEIEAARDMSVATAMKPAPTVGALATFRPRTAAEMATLNGQVPADLRGTVRVVQDPLLSGKTIHVVPMANEVQIRVGLEVSDVTDHVDVARDQARFVGTVGRLRATIARFTDVLAGRRKRGTRGREAEQEIEKLARIADDLRARSEWLEGRAADIDHPLNEVERAEIDDRIRSIEAQVLLHSRELSSLEAGRGFIAAVDSKATVRDALLRGGVEEPEVRDFVKELQRQSQLDAFAQLISVGTYQRLRKAGVSDAAILTTLGTQNGYRDLVQADLDPTLASSRLTIGAGAAKTLQESRLAQAAATARTTPGDQLRAEWGIESGGTFSPAELKKGTGFTVAEVMRQSRSAVETTEPRILWRWKRYADRMELRRPTEADFARWAESGWRANSNRDVSSPFERTAVEQLGGFLNNEALGAGGHKTYEYGEYVTGLGRFVRSGIKGGRKPGTAKGFVEVTTRPDGLRPRPDGGFDVIEHKHVTSGEDRTLNDSIQLRAQREMATRIGKGHHELVLSSDQPLGRDGLPTVQPSATVGSAPHAMVYYLDNGKISHTWNPSRNAWEPGIRRSP